MLSNNNYGRDFGLVNHNYDNDGDEYPEFLEAVKEYFSSQINKGVKLFTTSADYLYETFLDKLPDEAKQHYTCNCCKQFFERFGGLVTILENGEMVPAMWNEHMVPPFFRPAVKVLRNGVALARVTGVFLPSSLNLGTPMTGEWNHLSVKVPLAMVYRDRLLTAEQKMAEKKEEYKMVNHALIDYSEQTVDTALELLRSDSLYRSEKCLGVAEWLKDLIVARKQPRNIRTKENLVWLAVATAPVGYTHVRSSMIGTLLDDIKIGMSFNSVSARFKEKMNPLQYQRPTAQPKAGNIIRGNEIIEKLGLEKSLERRFATVDEIKALWRPQPTRKKPISGSQLGVFSHVTPKNSNPTPSKMTLPSKTMTWLKFFKEVLPMAESIEYYVKPTNQNFSGIVTAMYPDAPPIIQWDREEERNPFSHYVYSNGSPASRWGLSTGYTKVTAVTLQPSMWSAEHDYPHQGKSVFFILDGAKDKNFASRFSNNSNCLFPEILKSELHEIRSTIEAFAKTKTIEGYEESSACGIRLQSGNSWDAQFRVTTKSGTAVYKLDRWD